MWPDDITSDTSLFTSGGVAFGPRFTVNFQGLYTATPTPEPATWQRISIDRLREAYSSLHEAYPDHSWSYDSANHTFYGTPVMDVITSAPEPLVISATPTGTTNLFMDMFQHYTVNELISAGGQVTEPPTSGAYFVDYSPTEVNLRPGGTPFTEINQDYRMGMQADAPNAITAEQAQEGFDRLTRVHAQNLQAELHRTDDHISYVTQNAVRNIEHVVCVFEPNARTAIQRNMLAEAALGRYEMPLSDNMIMPESNVMRALDDELERQRVHALADYTEEDGRIHVKDQDELHALMNYIEISNPRLICSPPVGKPWSYRVINDKYVYVESELTDKWAECSVRDRYGEYSVPEFLALNRDEPEYRDMCEKINQFWGKEEENE